MGMLYSHRFVEEQDQVGERPLVEKMEVLGVMEWGGKIMSPTNVRPFLSTVTSTGKKSVLVYVMLQKP
jgi:hypothetical protein